jgi:Cu/Ag efflux protein CusF
LVTLCAAATGLWLAACSEELPSADSREQPNIRMYAVRGFVRSAPNLADRTITIEHEDIPGFMPAMTMPFAFRDPKQLPVGLGPLHTQYDGKGTAWRRRGIRCSPGRSFPTISNRGDSQPASRLKCKS